MRRLLWSWTCAVLVLCGVASSEAQVPGPTPLPGAAPAASSAGATADPLDRLVTLDMRDVPIGQAIQAVDEQGGLGLAYSEALLPAGKRVTVRVSRVPAREALKKILAGTGLGVKRSASGVLILAKERTTRAAVETSAEQGAVGAIGGYVKDTASQQPLKGAQVMVENTSLAAVTNESGAYLIPGVPVGQQTVRVRFIGYAPVVQTVTIGESEGVRMDFWMAPRPTRLDEVVTTATGQRRRVELGNDITIIDADSIARTQPITSVTQLLENRVPGLTLRHTSGAPGDPSRLRLRGAASAYGSNDPIVIVDGTRVYAAQSDLRSANLAAPKADAGGTRDVIATPAPSPLDQLDPHSIETIEVLKGPSAATLYGADAANGVIVITTKKGRAGPPRWTASAERGLSYMPGGYPEQYFRWGHNLFDNSSRWCPVTDLRCAADSLVRFQTLNDRALTPLGHGARTAVTLGVSGGSAALQYALTGSFSDELGLLRLPDFAARGFQEAQGGAPPGWMRRPHAYKTFNGSSRVTAQIGSSADVSLTTGFSRGEQRRSSLEGQLASLMYTYIDPAAGGYLQAMSNGYFPASELLSGFYQRTTDVATTFTNGVSANWRPRSWLSGSADAGMQLISREDEALLQRRYSPSGDSVGLFRRGNGSSLVGTLNLRGTVTAPPLWGMTLRAAVGANYTSTRTHDVVLGGTDIPLGATSPAQARNQSGSGESRSAAATFGWYMEPTLNTKRLFVSTGLRIDGGNTYGARARLAGFPKVGVSYLISDEPFFPFKSLFTTLRLRAAYGHAGVQPGARDRLRLYNMWLPALLDSQAVDVTQLQSLGNTKLRSERSTELEAGFDASLAGDRLSLSLSGYRKTREDALMPVPLPPSVAGEGTSILENVGVIRNTGLEATLGAEVVRSDPVTWNVQLSVSRNRNMVVSLGPGVTPFGVASGGVLSRVQAGYPLFGIWAPPIVGFADANHDGVLEPNEVQVGDSATYLGAPTPDYEASLHTGLSLFRGALRIDAGFAYERGLTQVNVTQLDRQAASRALNDPSAPLGELAGTLVLSPPNDWTPVGLARTTVYGVVQSVSTLRFNSFSVAYNVPTSMAQWVGARALSLALQGTNLGLFTNYRGKDPNVNAYASGDGVLDAGQLPAPRSFQLRVNLQY